MPIGGFAAAAPAAAAPVAAAEPEEEAPAAQEKTLFSVKLVSFETAAKPKVIKEVTEEEKARQAALAARPPIDNILNMHDFEVIAKAVIPEKAWAYYSSAADDESESIYDTPAIVH